MPTKKRSIDLDTFWAELDALGAKDFLPHGIPAASGDDAMKREYDFPGTERGKVFRKLARSALPQTGTGEVFVDREGYTIVVFPENIHVEVNTMRASRYGKKVILMPIKKKMRPPPSGRRPSTRLTCDFRETVRARAERDPAFNAKLGGYVRLWRRKQTRTPAPKI